MPEPPVECYAGARYPERPLAFHWQGERLTVAEVERQWRTPTELVFHVRTIDGRRFALTYREAGEPGTEEWRIEPLT